MNGASALADLRDIHLPQPIGWWPPAPGWWLVAATILLLLCLIAWLLARRRKTTLKRVALAELEQISAQRQQSGDELQTVKELSTLLRRVCISLEPDRRCAALTGESWLQHLDQLGRAERFCSETGRLLIEAPYRPQTNIDCTELLNLCRSWLQQLPLKRKAEVR